MFQAIVLGAVQGLTEFLPVSSSGHLIFVPVLFGWADQGIWFDLIVHAGTLLAVFVYYRKILLKMFVSLLSAKEEYQQYRRLFFLLLISAIPAYIVGFIMSEMLDIEIRSAAVVGVNSIVWGIVLFGTERYAKKKGTFTVQTNSEPQSTNKIDGNVLSLSMIIKMGCAQVLALFPGVSRSGITMTAGLFSGLDKRSTADFSFLMSVPVIVVSTLLSIVQIMKHTGDTSVSFEVLFVGFLSAAVSGFLAISLLLNILKKWSFTPFVVYRVMIGVLILLFLV